jgi:hypothetical protein
MIVVQKVGTGHDLSPLEHYDTLGYVIAVLSLVAIWMIYRVSQIVKRRAAAVLAR